MCAPFAPNKNPPYLCTGTERQPLLSIILQALSLYGTSIGLLTAAVPAVVMARNFLYPKAAPAALTKAPPAEAPAAAPATAQP